MVDFFRDDSLMDFNYLNWLWIESSGLTWNFDIPLENLERKKKKENSEGFNESFLSKFIGNITKPLTMNFHNQQIETNLDKLSSIMIRIKRLIHHIRVPETFKILSIELSNWFKHKNVSLISKMIYLSRCFNEPKIMIF